MISFTFRYKDALTNQIYYIIDYNGNLVSLSENDFRMMASYEDQVKWEICLN